MHHFNQSYVLSHSNGIDEKLIQEVFDKIIDHHDALRMVYTQENGKVSQINRGKVGPLYDFFHSTYDLIRMCNKLSMGKPIVYKAKSI
ncbi:condensation domain-containing protein [Brevibacillus laterosporus]